MILLNLLEGGKGIPGDSEIVGYEKWIACTNISWALTREFKESSKAGTKDVFTGVADIPPIEVQKSFDAASIELMKFACGGGSPCAYAEIHLLTSGADMDKAKDNWYLKFKMENPIIASWNISGGEDERPGETLTLWYYKVQLTYRMFDGKTFKEVGTRGWDRVGHKAWDA
jgi:type VI protein secretion system component Hcp